MSKARSGNGRPADAMTPCVIAGAAILPSPLIRKSAAMRNRPTAPMYGLSLSMLALFRHRSISDYLLVLFNDDSADTFCGVCEKGRGLLASLVIGVNTMHGRWPYKT